MSGGAALTGFFSAESAAWVIPFAAEVILPFAASNADVSGAGILSGLTLMFPRSDWILDLAAVTALRSGAGRTAGFPPRPSIGPPPGDDGEDAAATPCGTSP